MSPLRERMIEDMILAGLALGTRQAYTQAVRRLAVRYRRSPDQIVSLDDGTVTIQYKERKTGRSRTCRLSGHEFMRRFLQHVLPCGFHKVRYFGLWHPAQRHNAARVRQMLHLQETPKFDAPADFVVPPLAPSGAEPAASTAPPICPHCQGRLIFIRTLSPRQAMAP